MAERDFESLLASIQQSALPVSSIDEDPVRDRILQADVIWGYDPQRDTMPLFYGKELLQEIARGREDEFGPQMLLCFQLDTSNRQEVEALRGIVQALKNSCCYEID